MQTATAHVPRATVENLPALTGLRGFAAVWVVCFHLCITVVGIFDLKQIPDIPFLRDGYLGVDAFFILSGFVLSHVYVKAFTPYSVREHLHFMAIRLARIYPLHLFTLILLAGVANVLPGFIERYTNPANFSASNWVVASLLLQNWTGRPMMWNGPAWSLSAEWVAYLVFPAPLMLARRVPRTNLALLLAGLCLLAVSAIFLANHHPIDAVGKGGFIRLAGEFTAGCLLHRAYVLGGLKGLAWPIFDGLTLLVLAFLFWHNKLIALAVVPLGALVVSLSVHRGAMHRFLASRPLVWLGDISYSVYLMHWICLQVLSWYSDKVGYTHDAARWAAILLSLSAILAGSMLTWRFVELPARRWGRHVADRLL